MEITLNVNINAPALVDLIQSAMKAQAQNAMSAAGGPVGAPKAAAEPKPTPAPVLATAPKPVEAAAETAKPAPKARAKKAASAQTDAPAGEITLPVLRDLLADYSADKRFGMKEVLARLSDFGVERISDLPKDRYAEFMGVLNTALAKPAADPLS